MIENQWRKSHKLQGKESGLWKWGLQEYNYAWWMESDKDFGEHRCTKWPWELVLNV